MSTWEERMSQRARGRVLSEKLDTPDELGQTVAQRLGVFIEWFKPDDPPGIMPQIIAARCLGITYGDPGPRLDPDMCRECWGERHVWLGNTWGLSHRGARSSLNCQHECHAGEVWMAATG